MNVSRFSEVLRDCRPTVTALVDITTTDETGSQQGTMRWRNLRAALADQGAAEDDLTVVDTVLAQPAEGAGPLSRLVAVRSGQVVLDEVLLRGTGNGIGSACVLPVVDVVPLLRYEASHVPVVVIRTDREGADLEVVSAFGAPPQDKRVVNGSTVDIHKVPVGGWHQLHGQRHTENVWRSNAEEVATEADRLLREHGAQAILVSGDVRARQLLTAALPQSLPVLSIEGNTRAEGADTLSVDLNVARVLDERAAHQEDDVVQGWLARHDDPGTRGRTTDDLPSTVAAAQRAQLEQLLLVPDALRPRQLRVGPAGTDIALPGSPVLWDGPVEKLPADLALIRAAALTGAEVQLVELESRVLSDGVAARLRWSMDPTADSAMEAPA